LLVLRATIFNNESIIIFNKKLIVSKKRKLLPPRPNKKVKYRIGGGGRNEWIQSTLIKDKNPGWWQES